MRWYCYYLLLNPDRQLWLRYPIFFLLVWPGCRLFGGGFAGRVPGSTWIQGSSGGGCRRWIIVIIIDVSAVVVGEIDSKVGQGRPSSVGRKSNVTYELFAGVQGVSCHVMKYMLFKYHFIISVSRCMFGFIVTMLFIYFYYLLISRKTPLI